MSERGSIADLRPTIGLLLATVLTCCTSGCTPRGTIIPPTDDASLGSSSDIANDVADRFVRRNPPAQLPWSWETAIFTLGLAQLAEVDGSSEWTTYLVEHYGTHSAPRIRRPDDCAPALGAALLLQQGENAGRPALEHVADYLRTAPRNPLGALDHLDPRTRLGRLYAPSIWIDSLVMYGLTAAWVGRALDDPELVALAHAQPVIFATHLQDPNTGLFRHAYLYKREHTRPESDAFWLRGNGWVALALVELLATMEPEQPEYLSTLVILRRLAAGLTGHRTPAGTWTTVVDAPRTYEETSGTALVAFALAKGARLGLLPPEYREQARQTLRTLNARLRPRRDGPSLRGTSGPTIPSRRAGYAAVSRSADVPYGVGAYLMLTAELSRDDASGSTTTVVFEQPAARHRR